MIVGSNEGSVGAVLSCGVYTAEPPPSKPPSGTVSRMTSLDEHSRQGSTAPSVLPGETDIPKEALEEGNSMSCPSLC